MKLYTKTGDDGTTGLFGGQRVAKDDPRIEAIGAVDELNAAVGLALAGCRHDEIAAILRTLQNRLFELGADISTPLEAKAKIQRIDIAHVGEAEHQIDVTSAPLPLMTHFILPGGGELSARLHLARTLARRAERSVLSLSRQQPINAAVLVYLNRMSDLLFALARRANQLEGIVDTPWIA